MIDGFHLLRPEALYGLAALPLALWFLLRRKHRTGNWQEEIDPELLPWLLPDGARISSGSPNLLLPLLLLGFTIVAIAGPSLQRAEVPVFQRADAMVIVLDLSDSMRANDVQPSRAERARQKVLDVLAEREEGVTGLVAYAGDAHVVTPLTDDRRTIENLLPSLTPDIMPIPGANTEAALREAMTLIKTAGMANGKIMLITDGMPKFDPTTIAGELALANIEVGILGVGTAQGAPMPLPEGGFIRDASGEIVVPVLDSSELNRIATALSADYEEVRLDNRDIGALLAGDPAELASGVSLDRRTDTWIDQGYWLALLIAAGLLPLFRRGALMVLVVVGLGSADTHAQSRWDSLWQTPDQQGAASLSVGNAEAAATQFEDRSWRGTAQFEAGDYSSAAGSFSEIKDADGFYNLGNALAVSGDLNGALAAYEQSLTLEPDQEDAIRNKELIEQALEQQEQEQQEQDQEDGEQNSDESQSENNEQGQDQQQDSSEQSDAQSDSQPQDQSSQQNQQSSDASQDEEGTSQEMQEEMEQRLDEQTAMQMRKFDQALEDQQKLEQWLRRVPDEPGGLLRNKFRYQAIQRLKKGEKPDEDVRW